MGKGTPVYLPKLGESITTATIVKWLKKEGDSVKEDEPLLEVATDKVSSEIPSPKDGVVTKCIACVDEELDVGAILCYLDGEPIEEKPVATPKEVSSPTVRKERIRGNTFYTPLVKKLVRAHGINIDELETIAGSGTGGRVAKKDLLAYLEGRESSAGSWIPMCAVRQAISDNLQKSVSTIPQATLVQEIDVTQALKVVEEKKAKGEKMSVTHVVLSVLGRVLPKYPLLYATFDVRGIRINKELNMGLAVNVDDNVQVPVIRSLQTLTLSELIEAVHLLVQRARSKKLTREDRSDGRITLTNFGMTGVRGGFPIIRYPEAAILGMGSIDKRVVVDDEDQFVYRKMMDLTLVFDHRILDGMYACRFLEEFAKGMKNVDTFTAS
jgi:2-oxoglutarate dehydrogenase E2 component (dihydrolipoamide succinyltransferase)